MAIGQLKKKMSDGNSTCRLDPMDTRKTNGHFQVHLTNGMSNGLLIFPSDILHGYWTLIDVCKSFGQIENIQNIESSDQGTVLRLRKMIQVSQGLLKTLLASFLAVTPHSMVTERVVSHYNRVKTEDRACLKQTTINNVLQISLNGKGTVLFDPREAVAEFLNRKSRRNSQPDTELFKDREYMRKLYRESSGCL
jgi:hypothetical protein